MKKKLLFLSFLLVVPTSYLLKAQSAAILIKSAPDVFVFLDGNFRGNGAGNGEILIRDIEPGKHTLKFAKSGETSFEKDFEVQKGKMYVYTEPFSINGNNTPKREFTMQEAPPPPPPASLDLVEFKEVQDKEVEIVDFTLMDDDMDAEWDFMAEDEEEVDDENNPCSEVFFIVEDMPQFQGKDSDYFRTYIAENLQYPKIAAENGISGRVFVQFTVTKTGEVIDVAVARGVDPVLDKEAVRVVKSSPPWTPGKQRGRPVCVKFTFPIVFILQ